MSAALSSASSALSFHGRRSGQDSPCLSLGGELGNSEVAQREADGMGQRDPEKQTQKVSYSAKASLKWVPTTYARVHAQSLQLCRLFVTIWAAAHQAPLSVGILQARIREWVAMLSLCQGVFPSPRIKPRSPTLQTDSLPTEPPGKPKNTGVGSLSLLQGIFLIQGSNSGLLHCRRILYQLSYWLTW